MKFSELPESPKCFAWEALLKATSSMNFDHSVIVNEALGKKIVTGFVKMERYDSAPLPAKTKLA